jgi:uncharacterized protein (TIGR04222 family)
MIRKISHVFIIVLVFSLLLASPAMAAKSYYAERFDVQIDIQENGSAIVTETVEFYFSGDPFTYAFREISANKTDGITFLEASMDGMLMPHGRGAGQVEVEEGNPLKVTWHFPPASDTSHVFTVRYRAEGVIRKGDGDTLVWRAIPEDHEYPIEHSTITLTYPSQATLLEEPVLDWDHDSAWDQDRIVLTASDIGEDEDLILTARFAPNSLTQAAPQWQVQKDRAQAATARALPVGLIAGIATLILGGLGLFTYARANARELSISPVVSNASPPSDTSPAIIGKLTGQQHNFMGAVFDLAQRGVLVVREEKGTWGTKHHLLVRRDHNEALNPFEQGLLDAIFKADESQVKMSEVAGRLATKSKLFDEPLEQELVQRGWLDLERKQKRVWLIAAGILILLGALAVFIFSMVGWGISLSENPGWLPWTAIAAGIGAGLFIVSILLLIYATTYSVLTPAGEEQAARWRGFADYLKQVSKGREPAIRPDYFERYLAYAAVFGLGAGWAKYFQDLGAVPLPVWFHAAAGSQGNFGAMVAMMSASDSASASSGGGGGAGASGGGSSGAG